MCIVIYGLYNNRHEEDETVCHSEDQFKYYIQPPEVRA